MENESNQFYCTLPYLINKLDEFHFNISLRVKYNPPKTSHARQRLYQHRLLVCLKRDITLDEVPAGYLLKTLYIPHLELRFATVMDRTVEIYYKGYRVPDDFFGNDTSDFYQQLDKITRRRK